MVGSAVGEADGPMSRLTRGVSMVGASRFRGSSSTSGALFMLDGSIFWDYAGSGDLTCLQPWLQLFSFQKYWKLKVLDSRARRVSAGVAFFR